MGSGSKSRVVRSSEDVSRASARKDLSRINDRGAAEYEAAKMCLQSEPGQWAQYVRHLKSAARHGHAAAQENLAGWYLEGIRDPTGRVILRRSPTTAVRLLESAVAAGRLNAVFTLARCFDMGLGVTRDSAKALALYRKAHRSGDPLAAWNLAILYRELGEQRLSDQWFLRAANDGDSDAIIEVAKLTQSRKWSRNRAQQAIRRLRKLARDDHDPEAIGARELLAQLQTERGRRGATPRTVRARRRD